MSVVFDLLPKAYPDAGPDIGWIVSLVGFIGIIFGVVAGVLVARIRYRRALLGALWLGASVSFFQALLPSLPLMLLSRVAEGVSHLALVVAAPTLIAQLSAPRHRGFTLTLWGTFFGVAFAVLALAGRPLAISFGLPSLFVAHGVYMAGFALYLSARLKTLPNDTIRAEFSFRRVLSSHVIIYRSASLAAPAAGWLFYTFSFVSILTVLPPFLDADIRAFIMGAMPITSIIVSMTFGVLLLRVMPAIWVVQLGFLLSMICALWLWMTPGAPVACLCLAGAMGLIQGASFAAVPQLNHGADSQALANGAMAQMGNIGNTLGTPIMAAALVGMGYIALPLLAGGAFTFGLIAHLWLGRIRQS